MSEELNPADAAGTEEGELEQAEVPETDQDDTPDGADIEKADDGDEKPKRETAKERRERDKAYKAKLREEAETLKARVAQAERQRQRILDAGKSLVEPVESDFTDYTEFVAAKAVWRHAQQAAERDASMVDAETETVKQRAQELEQLEKQLAAQAWAAQVEEARTRYADFEAVALGNDVPITEQMAEMIRASDNGADVAYYLGKNRALAAEISKMQPLEAARAIGRIEAQVTAPRPRTETKAPDPITPVRGKATATKDPAKMGYAEFKAWREAGGKIG